MSRLLRYGARLFIVICLNPVAQAAGDGLPIPIWSLRQSTPIIKNSEGLSLASLNRGFVCPPLTQFQIPVSQIAPHFDSVSHLTQFYARTATPDPITLYEVDSLLNWSQSGIPLNAAAPWLAVDLDRDGHIELVSQWSDALEIHSAPDWTLRASWTWPGYNVEMNPQALNLDEDPELELFAAPSTFSTSRIVIIDFDTVSGSFVVIEDLPLPFPAFGVAIGDFDEDGRVEFIAGDNNWGYNLFEWQDTAIAYIGFVGDSLSGGNNEAVTCRPKPGGQLHALVGHSSFTHGYVYQLLKATDDNQFEVVHRFELGAETVGIHPCHAADVDCDGLDELVMSAYPVTSLWEWSTDSTSFVQICSWDDRTEFGTPIRFYTVDLDQNGSDEWASVNHLDTFRAFPGPECVACDNGGHCRNPDPACFCMCHGDPACDGVVNVLDVVTAVDVAFRSGTPESDILPQCPGTLTDVTCDSVTNVLDVVHLVNVAFKGSSAAVEFCDPCTP